jgi:GT2 family glycosyltransferase
MDRILASIPTREDNPSWGVYEHVKAAARHVAEIGRATAFLAIHPCKYGVAQARNMAVAEMLSDKCSHLFFCDDDVYVPENTISELVAMDKDIAGGCYPSVKQNPGELKVETYVVVTENRKWIKHWFKGTRQVDAVGTGCVLIKRSVFEKMPFPWFRWGEHLIEGKYQQQSDDLDFCNRCRQKGIEVWANGDIRCGHVKPVDVANFIVEA